MQLKVKVRGGKIVRLTLVSEDDGDKRIIEALYKYEVTRERMIYRQGKVILQAKIDPLKKR